MSTKETQTTYSVPVINTKYVNVVGTNINLKDNVLSALQNAQKVLKDKAATNVQKNNAQMLIRQLRLMDKSQYFIDHCITVGPKQTQEAAFVYNNILNYIRANNWQMPTLQEYYRILPDYIRVLYNNKAKMRLRDICGCKIDDATLNQMEKTGALFVYEYLATGAAYCVTTKINSAGVAQATRTLVTANLNICLTLYNAGSLPQEIEKYATSTDFANTMESNLYSATATKHLQNGKCTVLNLKPLSVVKGLSQYTITKRQTPLTLIGEPDVKVYPIEACNLLFKFIANGVQENICELVTYDEEKQKDHTMALTSSREIAEECYQTMTDETETLIDVATTTGLIGWNAGNLKIGLYRLDKEDLTVGAFYPDTVKRVKLNEDSTEFKEKYTHTDANWRDCLAARMIFNTTIGNLKKKDFETFEGVVPGVENVVLRKDKKALVIAWGLQLRDEDLYTEMDTGSLSGLFPDLRTLCQNRRKTMPVYLKRFVKLTIPKQATTDAIIQTYYDCMKSGVLKIVYITKTGKVKTIKLTNNAKILARTYGKNYIGEWETPKIRLEAALNAIKTQERDATIEINLRKILTYFDVESIIFPDGIPAEAVKDVNGVSDLKITVVKKYLLDALTALQNKGTSTDDGKKAKAKVEPSITGRVADGITLEAYGNTVTFYRTLKLDTIVSVTFARMNTDK